MDYKLLLVCFGMLIGLSFQRDERLTALKERALALLGRRSRERARLRINGEYSGPLGEARGRIRADRRDGIGLNARRLDLEGGYSGILGGVEGHFLSDARRDRRPFGGVGIRRKMDAGISARRLSGASIGARGMFTGGMDAGLTGVAGEIRGGLEGRVRGPFGAGASGGFDGGFRGSVGAPVVGGGYIVRRTYRQH